MRPGIAAAPASGDSLGQAAPAAVLCRSETLEAALVEFAAPIADDPFAQEAALRFDAGATARLGGEIILPDGAGDGIEPRLEIAGVEESAEAALGIARQILIMQLDGMGPFLPALQGIQKPVARPRSA